MQDKQLMALGEMLKKEANIPSSSPQFQDYKRYNAIPMVEKHRSDLSGSNFCIITRSPDTPTQFVESIRFNVPAIEKLYLSNSIKQYFEPYPVPKIDADFCFNDTTLKLAMSQILKEGGSIDGI